MAFFWTCKFPLNYKGILGVRKRAFFLNTIKTIKGRTTAPLGRRRCATMDVYPPPPVRKGPNAAFFLLGAATPKKTWTENKRKQK